MRLMFIFGQSLLSGFGLIWLFLGAYCELESEPKLNLSYGFFVGSGGVVGVVWFFINGFYIAGYLKNSVRIISNAFDTSVTVAFGDIFKRDGFKVISVNDFFDSSVDDKHIATLSLHGKMITTYWKNSVTDWDEQVKSQLSGIPIKEVSSCRDSPAKQERYEIGTTVLTTCDIHNFLCVALGKTNDRTHEVSATYMELLEALDGLFLKARQVCNGNTLIIPLLGSGLARTGIKSNIIIDLILLAIFEECKKKKITNNIEIILPKHLKYRINLMNIVSDWK